MRRGLATQLFAFTVITGLARALAYAGTPIGRDLSAAALAEYVSLHVLAFSFAAFLVAALSRASMARVAMVALYAQGALFLSPFVDLAFGLPYDTYAATYIALPGGTAGGVIGGLAYGGIVAWAVWGAARRAKNLRTAYAVLAGILAVLGLALLAIAWPQGVFSPVPAYGQHTGMAIYDGLLALAFLDLAVRLTLPASHRAFWRRRDVGWLPAFALLPLVGVVAAGRLALLPLGNDPFQRPQIESPYVLGALAVGLLLWLQRTLVRLESAGSLRVELARLVKVVALALAFLAGPAPFFATLGAASLMWLERDRANPFAFAGIAALAVLVGDTAAVAVDFADVAVGPLALTFAIAQGMWPTAAGIVSAMVAGAVAGFASWTTTRISA